MRRLTTIAATLLALTLLLAIATAGSAQRPNDIFVINDGFVTKTYNHLGNPPAGS